MATATGNLDVMMADDDDDDCLFFADALEQVSPSTKLTCVSDGVELMETLRRLSNVGSLPHILFLDLNMPLRNGLDCLTEIRNTNELKQLPVIVFSTSAQKEAVDIAFERGAKLYLKKPDTFPKLKEILKKLLSMEWKDKGSPVSREDFLVDT
jgi:CheY-like chemotaxis protein